MPETTIERPKLKERDFLNSLILFILKLEVFLMPLFFLPFSFEAFEFGKQNLLWFLTGLAASLWLIKTFVVDKKIVYQRTPIDLPILIFLIFWAISAVFSVDRFSSFFGYYGRFTDAWFTGAALALFYFLASQTITKEQIIKFFNIFIWSGVLVLTTSFLALSGLLLKLPGAPAWLNIVRSYSFSPFGGSSESLALFSAAVLILTFALYSYSLKGERKTFKVNFKYHFLSVLAILNLVLINFSLSFIAIIFGSGAIFCFALYAAYSNREEKNNLIEIAIAPALVLFIAAILFLFIGSGQGGFDAHKFIFQNGVPKEITIPAAEGNAVVFKSVKNNPLFGSGPGTFAYDFSAYRSADFNGSQFWQLRFDKAPMQVMELLATVGILGTLSYLAMIGIFLFVSFVFLKNMFRTPSEESYLAFACSFTGFALFITQALYLVNTALLFIFWLMLALGFISWRLTYAKIFSVKEIDLAARKETAAIIYTFVFTAILLWLWLSYAQIKFCLADFNYNNFRLTGERTKLITAIKQNPARLNYHLALAKDYLNEVKSDISLLSSPGKAADLDNERKTKLQTNIQQALKEGEAATTVAPNSVMAWELLGSIYRDIRQIAVGSLEPAIRYFKKASELEPANPVLLTELGKLYLENNQTNEAVNIFERAVKLKNDYWEASVGLAKTYDSLGQTDKALVILEDLISKQPNPEVIYESGRLYYNQGTLDKAIERFNQVIAARPDYANAIYSLGLAYQKQGDKARAREQFNKILELNPGNEAIKKIIEEMGNQ
ncbi:MAG: tetratricopeptide repeat protein [Patescibacteria group bacterium]